MMTEKRTETLATRVSESEAEIIVRIARRHNMTVSDLIRIQLLRLVVLEQGKCLPLVQAVEHVL